MLNYMIDYMLESIMTIASFVVCWGVSFLISMYVIERIDKHNKKRKQD